MALDKSQSQGVDLESTDRLPILDGALFDADVEDDAVRMDFPPAVPGVKSDFQRASGVDLPSLADSVRSVEERISRQNAEYEVLSQSHEKLRDAEAAAVARTNALTADVSGLRALLESEQARIRDLNKSLTEKTAAAEATRGRFEEALRDAERHQGDARTLRDTLAARDATIAEVLHSLGERDAQLNALQRDHAQLVPALEERTRSAAQLEADLGAARTRSENTAKDLQDSQSSVTTLTARIRSTEGELQAARRELNGAKTSAASYLEQLQTREWRRGFDHNLFRELDASVGTAQNDRGVLQAERDQLRQRVTEMESKLAARDEAIAKLQAALEDDETLRVKHEMKLAQIEDARTELMQKITALDGERTRLNGELAARDGSIVQLKAEAAAGDTARAEQVFMLQKAERTAEELKARIAALESEQSRMIGELAVKERAVADALAAGNSEAQCANELLAAADEDLVKLREEAERLQSDLRKGEAVTAALRADLQAARRPIEPLEAEVKRLTEEMSAKGAALEQLSEENRNLRAALERARGALEEREFLIRRLERSESNNANVLGRIQTSIERLGSAAGPQHLPVAPPVECSAELIRVDGDRKTSHVLGRRTRIGRAPGCEMQIESSSVSRSHALVLMGAREIIVEDLNSTNGVIVNGRKISRQLLNDGDLLTIGEAQFRVSSKIAPRVLDAPQAAAPEAK